MKLRIITLLCLVLAAINSINAADNKASDQIYYKQFQEVFERINKDYVQDPDKQKMTDSAINGMLNSLDPHSSYFTDEDLEDFVNQTKGEFGGIGVEVMFDNSAIKVISPIDDLPADKAGIKSGDYIVGVDDELVSSLGFNKAVKAMRGEPSTKVKLLVVKEGENKPREIELVREIVKIKPVKAHLEEGNVAYVRIVTFNESTIDELKKAFKELQAKALSDSKAKDNKETASSGIKGIILDLRNNPGGLLDQAVAVSEYFIDSGVVVTTKGRSAGNDTTLTASKSSEKAPKVPLVVLINSGSASASEIVAGAIQDVQRGVIVGTRSFGKGSVQTVMPVSPRAAVKLTTAKYYTPKGRSIQAEGIEPDITIEPAKIEYATSSVEEKRFSETSLKNYMKNDKDKELKEKDLLGKDKQTQTDKNKGKEPVQEAPKKSQSDSTKAEEASSAAKTGKQLSDFYKKDYQFARAYDLILGLILMQNK